MEVHIPEKATAELLWSLQVTANQARKLLIARLCEASIEDAISFWGLSCRDVKAAPVTTTRNYLNYLKDLINRDILSLRNESNQLYSIDQLTELYPVICKRLAECDLSVNEKRYRMHALMAFTKFLESVSDKKIKAIIAPLSFELSSTNKREAPPILNQQELRIILNLIKDSCFRDYLVVNLVKTTAKNLNQILSLKIPDIDFENRGIQIANKKLHFSAHLMDQLKQYVDSTQQDRKDNVLFITRVGKPVYRTHFQHVLDQASEKADLGFRVSMTMIQWSEVAQSLIDHQGKIDEVLCEFNLQTLPKFLKAVAGNNRK